MGKTQTRPRMSMKDFWRELAQLIDLQNWAVELNHGAINLIPPEELCLGYPLDPVQAIAHAKYPELVLRSLGEDCRLIGLPLKAGERITKSPARNSTPQSKTKKRKFIKNLCLKKKKKNPPPPHRHNWGVGGGFLCKNF